MDKEQQKDKIIEIVKKAIYDNSIVEKDTAYIIVFDSNDVDHIAEEVAKAVYNFYKPIDKEPVGAMYIEGCRKGFFDRDNQVKTLARAVKELKDENAGLNRECNDYCAKIDRLQEKLAQVLMGVDKTKEWTLDRAKIEGAKEFAEKLKNVIHERDYIQGYAEIGLIEEIDELLKEYTE